MFQSNLLALVVTTLIALGWLKFCDLLAARKVVSSQVSRKIIHIGTGPIFVLCWLLFNDAPGARWLAAIVPLGITLKFLLVGLGVIKDEGDVQSMSRSGDRRELLRGPLFYGIAFVALTLLFWKESPVGIIALMLLCGGDGAADLAGSHWGKDSPLPWSSKKSWAGSLAMLIFGFALSFAMVLIFNAAGAYSYTFTKLLISTGVISLAAMLVESLPIGGYDNLAVPLVASVLGLVLF